MAAHVFLMGAGSGAVYADYCAPASRVHTWQVTRLLISCSGVALLWFLYFLCSLSVGRCRNSPRPSDQPAGALCFGRFGLFVSS